MGGRNLNLPEELQTEILSNLPVKSLMRFKSVAKSWKNLLRSSSFISKQLSASSAKNKSNPLLIVMVHQEERPGSNLLTLISQDGPSPVLEKPFADEDLRFIHSYGPCNGIFCLNCYHKDGRDLLILWNPATREVKVVPPPLVPPSVKHSRPLYGFGVDPNTNAYKIVKLLMLSAPYGLYNKPAIAEVYNLTTDSWRIIHDTVPACYIMESERLNSYVNGVHCWLTGDYDTSILCFDMRSETFERIKLPPSSYVSSLSDERLWRHSGVSITNGRICYFCLCRINDGAHFEVTVMSDYDDVERTWTRSSFTLQYQPRNRTPGFLGFWKDSEMILATNLSEQLLSYKFDNSKMWRVGEIEVNKDCHWLREYVASIVPLNV